MRFEIFTAVIVHIVVVCIVLLFSLAGDYRRFEEHSVTSHRVEVSRARNLMTYIGRFLGRWSLRSTFLIGPGRPPSHPPFRHSESPLSLKP
jgi:hypothetical protein